MGNTFNMYEWRRKFTLMAEADLDPELQEQYDPQIHGKILDCCETQYFPSRFNPKVVNFYVKTEKDTNKNKRISIPFAKLESYISEYDSIADTTLDDLDDYADRFFESCNRQNLDEYFFNSLQEKLYGKVEEQEFDASFVFEYFNEEEATLATDIANWIKSNQEIIDMCLDFDNGVEGVAKIGKKYFPDIDSEKLKSIIGKNLNNETEEQSY